MTGVFINYRTGDGGYAAALLTERLTSVLGPDRVFLDSHALRPGVDFRLTLSDALRASTILLAVIGTGWLGAVDETGRRRLDDPEDYVRWEIRQAFANQLTVISVLLDDVSMPAPDLLPPDIRELAARQYVRLRVRDSTPDLGRIVTEVSGRLSPGPARRALWTPPAGDLFAEGGVKFGAGSSVTGPVIGRDQKIDEGRP